MKPFYNRDLDIILNVLETMLAEKPDSVFIKSLHQQYRERGGLSKKQLEGLLGKASRVESIAPAKLATLQAIILKKHSKHRSEVSAPPPAPTIDHGIEKLLTDLLEKYPNHKRVRLLQAKFDQQKMLSVPEIEELKKFSKILLK